MPAFTIELFACRSDNFGVLIHDELSGATALDRCAGRGADPRRAGAPRLDADPYLHHPPPCRPCGRQPAAQGALRCADHRSGAGGGTDPGIDLTIGDGGDFTFAGRAVHVIGTPGHTAGHICYHLPEDHLLFAADTLFALGCGRLFEGTPLDMWTSLSKLMELPTRRWSISGHEYTLSTARFAVTIDPQNAELQAGCGRSRRCGSAAGSRRRRRSGSRSAPIRSCAPVTRRSAPAWPRRRRRCRGLCRNPAAQGRVLMTADEIIETLQLETHPEGGYYRRTFGIRPAARAATRPPSIISCAPASAHPLAPRARCCRSLALLCRRSAGAAHVGRRRGGRRRGGQGDRAWTGSPCRQRPQAVVPADVWQSAESRGAFTLVGCTVAPGFEFAASRWHLPTGHPPLSATKRGAPSYCAASGAGGAFQDHVLRGEHRPAGDEQAGKPMASEGSAKPKRTSISVESTGAE